MQSFVGFFVAMVVSTSAHHLGLIGHPSAPWVSGPDAGAIRFISADPATASAEESALTRAMIAASAGSPVGSAAASASPLIRALTAAAEKDALTRSMVGDSASTHIVSPLSPTTAFSLASASSPWTRALSPAGPMVKVCGEGVCKIIPTAALLAPSAAGLFASSGLDARKASPFAAPVGAGISFIDAASPAGVFIDPMSAAKFGAGGVMVPIDAASAAAAFIDPTSAADALAAAKFAGAGGVLIPADAASPADAFAKYFADASVADLTGAAEAAWASPMSAMTAAKYANAAKNAAAAKIAADAFAAAGLTGNDEVLMAVDAAWAHPASAKYAAAKYAADVASASPLSAGRLVKVCAGGACKIVDSASAAAAGWFGPGAVAAPGDAAAKYAAAVRGLSAAKHADDAAKFAAAIGAKLIVAE